MPVREKKTLGLEWNWRIYDLSPRSTLISNVSRRLFFRILFSSTFLLLYSPSSFIHTFDDIWSRKLLVRRIRHPPVMSFLLHAYLVAVPIYTYIYIYLFPIASFRLVLYRDLDIFLYSVLSIPSSIDNYIILGNNDRSSFFLLFPFIFPPILLLFSFLYLFFLFLFYFIFLTDSNQKRRRRVKQFVAINLRGAPATYIRGTLAYSSWGNFQRRRGDERWKSKERRRVGKGKRKKKEREKKRERQRKPGIFQYPILRTAMRVQGSRTAMGQTWCRVHTSGKPRNSSLKKIEIGLSIYFPNCHRNIIPQYYFSYS